MDKQTSGTMRDLENRIKVLKKYIKRHDKALTKHSYHTDMERNNIIAKRDMRMQKMAEYESQINELIIKDEMNTQSRVVGRLDRFMRGCYPNLKHKIVTSKTTGSIYLTISLDGKIGKTVRFSGHNSKDFKKTYSLNCIYRKNDLHQIVKSCVRVLKDINIYKAFEEIEIKEKISNERNRT